MCEFVGDGIYNAGGAGGGGPQDIGTWETITNDCTWNYSHSGGANISYFRKILQFNSFLKAVRFYVQIKFSAAISDSTFDLVKLPNGYTFDFPFKFLGDVFLSNGDQYLKKDGCCFTNLSGSQNAPQSMSSDTISITVDSTDGGIIFINGGGLLFVDKS